MGASRPLATGPSHWALAVIATNSRVAVSMRMGITQRGSGTTFAATACALFEVRRMISVSRSNVTPTDNATMPKRLITKAVAA
ncbi:hypothetical protein D3C81_1536470 [compost metagenome]